MNRSATAPINVHGTCVALTCAGRTTGVLLQGASGSGKSSLALRLIDQPGFGVGSEIPILGHLVSDDQVLLEVTDGTLTATAPHAIDGLIEVRGMGIIKTQTAVSPVCVELVVAHANSSGLERIPEPEVIELAGQALPLHKIDFSSPSAAAQVRSLAQIQWGLASSSNR
jgi:serine kinase of HPr protein (carbohydrate metabolism regulator)